MPAKNLTSATRRPVVLLLQRLVKRFILNIEELAEATRRLGAEAVIYRLESLPLYEQLYHIRRADVVVGMHGSGMSNVKLMRAGTGLVEIMPYQAKGNALLHCYIYARSTMSGVQLRK
jgi:capsular polysaccharide biosynthesis protein